MKALHDAIVVIMAQHFVFRTKFFPGLTRADLVDQLAALFHLAP